MATFTAYEKIAESSAAWRLDAAGFRALRRVPWAVTEKIHGSNFCFVVEGGVISGRSRRRPLADDEPFFSWQAVRDELATGLREIAVRAKAVAPDAERVCIYGELFGGAYPHPDVAPVPGVEPIQTGVWYAPGIHFLAFDIAVEAGSTKRYLDWEWSRATLMAAGAPCATPLLIGTYEQATDYPIRFDSTIPALLGLPPFPRGTNLAEGVVVRPVREIAVAGESGTIRPLLKLKIPEFAEDIRFHEATAWTHPVASNTSSAALDMLKWEAYCRITENRLDAALSKVGPRPARERQQWAGDLFALLSTEVMDEARYAVSDLWAGLSPALRREWETYVCTELRTLLKARFGEKTRS